MTVVLNDGWSKDRNGAVLADFGQLEKTLRAIHHRLLRQTAANEAENGDVKRLLISASKAAFVCTAELRARQGAKSR